MTLKPLPRARRVCAAAAAAAALCLVLASPVSRAQPITGPQPQLASAQLSAGIHLIRAEVAANDATRMRGLMFRERLGPNEGMLFVFDEKRRQCFWMRNTLLPLSIAFLDDDGTVVNVADMQPRSDDSHCSARPIRYALEMEQGWFARRGVAPGTRLRGPAGMFTAR